MKHWEMDVDEYYDTETDKLFTQAEADTITAELFDEPEVDEYTDLTLAFVRYDGRKYLIELPEDTYEFDSKEALLENIRYNLEELRKETRGENNNLE